MNDPTKLRDALATQIQGRLFEYPVDVVVVPDYQREDLVKSPRVAVMLNGDDFVVEQGPDMITATIGIGLAGAAQKPAGIAAQLSDAYKAERDKADQYYRDLNEIRRLWVPTGPLLEADIEGFRFHEITRPSLVDFDLYRERHVWLSILFATYHDTEDE